MGGYGYNIIKLSLVSLNKASIQDWSFLGNLEVPTLTMPVGGAGLRVEQPMSWSSCFGNKARLSPAGAGA